MLLWIFADSFDIFILSRIVGGLTEGNVQMSIAMISDLTTPETRSRSLALVGMAFAFGFTVGPPMGAYLTHVDMSKFFPGFPLNPYSAPAFFAFALIIIEILFLMYQLPETLDYQSSKKENEKESLVLLEKDSHETTPLKRRSARFQSKSTSLDETPKKEMTPLKQSKNVKFNIRWLSLIHFLFVFMFSGMEFTLTFLTHERFSFSHGSQGMLLGFIGLSSALIQGFYVRKFSRVYFSEKIIAFQGIVSCALGLFINGALANRVEILYMGSFCLAFTSGTVVNSLTALASLNQEKNQKRGHVLGIFRSYGQLGRSFGPIVFCSLYWIIGGKVVYLACSGLILILSFFLYF